jgi:hypothetical protein
MSFEIPDVITREDQIAWLAFWLRRSCLSCVHFAPSSEFCKMVSARPPAKVIAFGCEKYDQDIPF